MFLAQISGFSVASDDLIDGMHMFGNVIRDLLRATVDMLHACGLFAPIVPPISARCGPYWRPLVGLIWPIVPLKWPVDGPKMSHNYITMTP